MISPSVLLISPARIERIVDFPQPLGPTIEINLEDRSTPTNNRKSKDFSKYYDILWRDLDVHL